MGNRFVSKIFGVRSQVTPDVKEALAELERHAAQRPELSAASALLADLIPLVFEMPLKVAPPELSADHIAAKLAGGVPLLRGENLIIDAGKFKKRWQVICTIMERHQRNGTAEAVSKSLWHNRWTANELVQGLLAGQPDSISQRADQLGLDAATVLSVLRLTMLPFLVEMNRLLRAGRERTPWRQGYCPTCGSWPLLGEFRGLEQVRFLRCGLCAAQWEFPRLMCPFCGVADHEQLGYLHVEGEESRRRAATCQACRGFVKMVSTLAALSPPQLLTAELATAHLDLIALERGYTAQP